MPKVLIISKFWTARLDPPCPSPLYEPAAGHLLVALYGANSGDVALCRLAGAINQAILCLRSSERVSFLHQFLLERKSWILQTYLQGGQGNLSGQIIMSIPLTLPKDNEQKKIAECLEAHDELIPRLRTH